jgi:hypothetical protein
MHASSFGGKGAWSRFKMTSGRSYQQIDVSQDGYP